MTRTTSLVLPCLLLVSACAAPSSAPSRGFYVASVEGVDMEIKAGIETARVTTTERGEAIGDSRRAVLTELEVGTRTRCETVTLTGQSVELRNDTTRATLTYALGGCPPVRTR